MNDDKDLQKKLMLAATRQAASTEAREFQKNLDFVNNYSGEHKTLPPSTPPQFDHLPAGENPKMDGDVEGTHVDTESQILYVALVVLRPDGSRALFASQNVGNHFIEWSDKVDGNNRDIDMNITVSITNPMVALVQPVGYMPPIPSGIYIANGPKYAVTKFAGRAASAKTAKPKTAAPNPNPSTATPSARRNPKTRRERAKANKK